MDQEQTRSSKTTNMINVTGTLKNLLDDGFNIESSIVELIDNSIGAGAKRIRIKLVKGQDNTIVELLIIDDGSGMNEDELYEAHVLSNRSDPSANKQGRFGIGGKYARAYISQLEHKATTITQKNGGELFQTVVNFPKHLRDNSYNPSTSEVSEKNKAVWLQHAIDPSASGTIISIPVSEKVIGDMYSLFRPTEIEKDIAYHYGYIYNDDIRNGLELSIEVHDQIQKKVVPIDKLYLDKVSQKNKRTVTVKVYKNRNDIRCYYTNVSGVYGYKNFTTVRGKFIKGDPSEPFVEVGEFTIDCAYDENKWDVIDAIQAGEFQKITGDDSESDSENTIDEESGLITKLRPFFGGRYYKRLNKIICRFDNEKAKSGDRAKYPIVEHSRFCITFPETLDDYFAIVVNKSKIDEKNINENVYKTIAAIKNEFIGAQYKLSLEEKAVISRVNTSAIARRRPTVIVSNSESGSDAESMDQSMDESVDESMDESVDESTNESEDQSNDSLSTISQLTQHQEVRETQIHTIVESVTDYVEDVNPSTPDSVTYVGAQIRHTPKSPLDIASVFKDNIFNPQSIDIIIAKASNITANGLTELFRKAIEIKELFEKIKNDTI